MWFSFEVVGEGGCDHSVSLIHRWSTAVGGELGSLNGGIATDHHGHRPGENAHQCEQHGAPVPVEHLERAKWCGSWLALACLRSRGARDVREQNVAGWQGTGGVSIRRDLYLAASFQRWRWLRLELMLVEPFAFECKVAVGINIMPMGHHPSGVPDIRFVGMLGVISYRNPSVDHRCVDHRCVA